MPTISAWACDGRIKLKFDYNRDLIEELKSRIPSNKRRWNGKNQVDRKTGIKTANPSGDDTWIVDTDQLDVIEQIAREYGYEIQAAVTEIPLAAVDSGADSYRMMFSSIPNELMKKIYKSVTLELHPDKGGDPTVFQDFNSGWTEIKKERNM
jgi:hypothetical protein